MHAVGEGFARRQPGHKSNATIHPALTSAVTPLVMRDAFLNHMKKLRRGFQILRGKYTKNNL